MQQQQQEHKHTHIREHKAPSAHTLLSSEHLFETIAIKSQSGVVPSHSSEADPQFWAA